eukprot:scaffold26378_cov206-Skeletonema_dohrnii-CCMP3373.AAC.3
MMTTPPTKTPNVLMTWLFPEPVRVTSNNLESNKDGLMQSCIAPFWKSRSFSVANTSRETNSIDSSSDVGSAASSEFGPLPSSFDAVSTTGKAAVVDPSRSERAGGLGGRL